VHDHDDVDTMSLDQLAAEADKLAAQVREMCKPAPAAPAFDSSPIPAALEEPTAPETPAAPTPARCECCGAPDCTTIVNDPRWLAPHQSRTDVKAFLDEQAAIRRRLGWDARTINVGPMTSGSTQADDPTAEMLESLRRQRDGDPWIR
jgi:hypothetical protein